MGDTGVTPKTQTPPAALWLQKLWPHLANQECVPPGTQLPWPPTLLAATLCASLEYLKPHAYEPLDFH